MNQGNYSENHILITLLCHPWSFSSRILKKIEELFHSICEFSSSPRSSPLLDTDFILPALDPLDSFSPFHYIRLPVCDKEGSSNIALILHHRFSTLRQKYEGVFDRDEMWPSGEQMSHLIRFFSDVFEPMDVVINFVNCMDGGGPRLHLETFLVYMAHSPSPSDEQPHCALDHLYIQAYSNIPPDLASLAKEILSIMDFAYYWPMTPLQLACLLSIEEATVLNVLTFLSRWVVFKTGENYETIELLRYFQEDPTRSGPGALL